MPGMIIQWQGHACFHVHGNTHGQPVRIVTDPYTAAIVGLAPITQAADVVIMSSDNDDYHSHAAGVPGQPIVINALEVARHGGMRDALGVRFAAIESQETLVYKDKPDDNALYRFALEGIEIGHMGDVGNPLTPGQTDFLRGVDVLLALTGGHNTIALDDLDVVLREVQPKLVIPMHYRIPNLRLDALGVEAFTDRYPDDITTVSPDTQIEIARDLLPSSMRIVVLQPLANT